MSILSELSELNLGILQLQAAQLRKAADDRGKGKGKWRTINGRRVWLPQGKEKEALKTHVDSFKDSAKEMGDLKKKNEEETEKGIKAWQDHKKMDTPKSKPSKKEKRWTDEKIDNEVDFPISRGEIDDSLESNKINTETKQLLKELIKYNTDIAEDNDEEPDREIIGEQFTVGDARRQLRHPDKMSAATRGYLEQDLLKGKVTDASKKHWGQPGQEKKNDVGKKSTSKSEKSPSSPKSKPSDDGEDRKKAARRAEKERWEAAQYKTNVLDFDAFPNKRLSPPAKEALKTLADDIRGKAELKIGNRVNSLYFPEQSDADKFLEKYPRMNSQHRFRTFRFHNKQSAEHLKAELDNPGDDGAKGEFERVPVSPGRGGRSYHIPKNRAERQKEIESLGKKIEAADGDIDEYSKRLKSPDITDKEFSDNIGRKRDRMEEQKKYKENLKLLKDYKSKK